MLVFKKARKFKHFENMTMFSSGMRKKYKKMETSTFGIDLERLYVASLNNKPITECWMLLKKRRVIKKLGLTVAETACTSD